MPSAPKQPNPEPLLVSVKEAAAMLGISRAYMYELLQARMVESRHIGRRHLVLVASLKAFVDRLPEDS